jgi:hypothetical protein
MSNLVVSFYFAKRGFENGARIYQAMSSVRNEEIRAIVAETLAEKRRLHHDETVVFRAIATILTSFGIEEEDRKEL